MKYFISFSILLFVSFTASAQEKKNKQEIKKRNISHDQFLLMRYKKNRIQEAKDFFTALI